MQLIKNEFIVAFDVDGTLVAPSVSGELSLENPYSKTIQSYDVFHKHVELLKQYRGRGLYVIVWSAGGADWGRVVVEALGLQDCVDLILTKPSKLIDDLPPEQVFTTRIFLGK